MDESFFPFSLFFFGGAVLRFVPPFLLTNRGDTNLRVEEKFLALKSKNEDKTATAFQKMHHCKVPSWMI